MTVGYNLKTLTSIGALLLTSFMAAQAEPAAITTNFNLDSGDPVTIYTQGDTEHPAPVFLICAGNGVYSVELIGLETIPPAACIYVSNDRIVARLPSESSQSIADTDAAIRNAAAWTDERIAELEAISEKTELETNLLKSLKEQRDTSAVVSGSPLEPPYVTVTLVR